MATHTANAMSNMVSRTAFGAPSCRPSVAGISLTPRRVVRRNARGDELFDEGAANVRRLLDRDRKDLMNEGQKAEYDTEFDRPEPSSSERSSNGSSSSSSDAASTSKSSAFDDELASMRNPMQKAFKSSPKRGAFGSSSSSPFGSESGGSGGFQGDMWANVEPVEDLAEEAWWKQISFSQVVIALSFVLVIGLMLGTTWVTVKLGAIHFNE